MVSKPLGRRVEFPLHGPMEPDAVLDVLEGMGAKCVKCDTGTPYAAWIYRAPYARSLLTDSPFKSLPLDKQASA